MKISIIVESKTTKDGRKFMAGSAEAKYLHGVKGVTEADEQSRTFYDVKVAKGVLPQAEGIYDVEMAEVDAWKDIRETTTRNTIWVRNAVFTKKLDLIKK